MSNEELKEKKTSWCQIKKKLNDLKYYFTR